MEDFCFREIYFYNGQPSVKMKRLTTENRLSCSLEELKEKVFPNCLGEQIIQDVNHWSSIFRVRSTWTPQGWVDGNFPLIESYNLIKVMRKKEVLCIHTSSYEVGDKLIAHVPNWLARPNENQWKILSLATYKDDGWHRV